MPFPSSSHDFHLRDQARYQPTNSSVPPVPRSVIEIGHGSLNQFADQANEAGYFSDSGPSRSRIRTRPDLASRPGYNGSANPSDNATLWDRSPEAAPQMDPHWNHSGNASNSRGVAHPTLVLSPDSSLVPPIVSSSLSDVMGSRPSPAARPFLSSHNSFLTSSSPRPSYANSHSLHGLGLSGPEFDRLDLSSDSPSHDTSSIALPPLSSLHPLDPASAPQNGDHSVELGDASWTPGMEDTDPHFSSNHPFFMNPEHSSNPDFRPLSPASKNRIEDAFPGDDDDDRDSNTSIIDPVSSCPTPSQESRSPAKDYSSSALPFRTDLDAFVRPMDRPALGPNGNLNPCTLYDIVLTLNSEPELESWWPNIVSYLHNNFAAQRICLSVPSDQSNAKWQLKAVYHEPDETVESLGKYAQSQESEVQSPAKSIQTNSEFSRSSLMNRYTTSNNSYDSPVASLLSPHSANVSFHRSPDLGSRNSALAPSARERYSSLDGSLNGHPLPQPNIQHIPSGVPVIFPEAQSLGKMFDPLIDDEVAKMVLERGDLVSVTRKYYQTEEEPRSQSCWSPPTSDFGTMHSDVDTASVLNTSGVNMHSSNGRYPGASESSIYPSPSPPQPSLLLPRPAASRYALSSQHEVSVSIIHVPLIHPFLSGSQTSRASVSNADTPDSLVRKTPVAILSLWSPAPYSSQISDFLRLLGPHLATSFTNALHLSRPHQTPLMPSRCSFSPSIPVSNDLPLRRRETPSPKANVSTDQSSVADRPFQLDRMVSTLGDETNFLAEKPSLPAYPTKTTVVSAQSLPQYTRSSCFNPNTPRSLNRPEFTYPGYSPSQTPETIEELSHDESEELDPGNESDLEDNDNLTSVPDAATESGAESPSSTGLVEQNKFAHASEAENGTEVPMVQDDPSLFPPLADNECCTSACNPRTPLCKSGTAISCQALHNIVDSLPNHVYSVSSPSSLILWANSAFLRYRGKPDLSEGVSLWAGIHPDDLEDANEHWRFCVESGTSFSKTVRLCSFDGEFEWFKVHLAPSWAGDQNAGIWMGSNTPFSMDHKAVGETRRTQERAVPERELEARTCVDPQIALTITRDTGVTACNSQWTSYTGQAESEALGFGFAQYVHPDDRNRCQIPENSVLEKTLEATATEDADDETAQDAEDPNSPLKHETQSLPRMPPALIFSTQCIPKVPDGDELPMTQVTYDSFGRLCYSTEVRLLSKSGTFRYHIARFVRLQLPLDDQQAETSSVIGEDPIWFGTFFDFHEHKIRELTLQRKMDSKTQFLSNMSHEIRTPINGILGTVHLLLASDISKEHLHTLDVIRRAAESLRMVTDDILDFSKVEAGKIALVRNWFNIRNLIEEVNDMASASMFKRDTELNYILEDQLPVWVKGDKNRVRQILVNIIGNAFKFTMTGEIVVRCRRITTQPSAPIRDPVTDELVSAAPTPMDNDVVLQFDVIDTGVGFSAADGELLFKRFSQIGTKCKYNSGTGLGLAISRHLARLHGGDMTAVGTPGKGATFTFTIHLSVPTEQDHPNCLNPYYDFLRRNNGDTSTLPADRDWVPMQGPLLPTDQLRPLFQPQPDNAWSICPHTMSPVLLVCPLKFAREALLKHIPRILPADVSIELYVPETVGEAIRSFDNGGGERFKSVILVHDEEATIGRFINLVLYGRPADAPFWGLDKQPLVSQSTSLLLATSHKSQKVAKKLIPKKTLTELFSRNQLRFITKPFKPAGLAPIFDPLNKRPIRLAEPDEEDGPQAAAEGVKGDMKELSRRLGHRGMRLLMFEDDNTSSSVLSRYLEHSGITLEVALDGESGTKLLFSHPPGYYSAILCDLHMPIKDGFQACLEIREWEEKNDLPSIPVVALSANVLDDVLNLCIKAKFTSYLTKPLNFKQLNVMLFGLLDPQADEEEKSVAAVPLDSRLAEA